MFSALHSDAYFTAHYADVWQAFSRVQTHQLRFLIWNYIFFVLMVGDHLYDGEVADFFWTMMGNIGIIAKRISQIPSQAFRARSQSKHSSEIRRLLDADSWGPLPDPLR